MWTNSEQNKELISFDMVEKKILDNIKKDWYLEEYKTITIKNISYNIYSVEWYTNNILYYCNKDSKIIFSLLPIMQDMFYKIAMILWCYRNVKWDDWRYRMYKIETIDWKPYKERIDGIDQLLDIDTNKLKIETWKELDKYSEDYYQAWLDIWFYIRSYALLAYKLKKNDWEYRVISDEWLNIDITFKAIRIKELESYLINKQITQESFDKFLPKIKALLPEQILDQRFDNVGNTITKKELDWYLDRGRITIQEYNLLLESLEEVEQQKRIKTMKEKALKHWTKWELERVWE